MADPIPNGTIGALDVQASRRVWRGAAKHGQKSAPSGRSASKLRAGTGAWREMWTEREHTQGSPPATPEIPSRGVELAAFSVRAAGGQRCSGRVRVGLSPPTEAVRPSKRADCPSDRRR